MRQRVQSLEAKLQAASSDAMAVAEAAAADEEAADAGAGGLMCVVSYVSGPLDAGTLLGRNCMGPQRGAHGQFEAAIFARTAAVEARRRVSGGDCEGSRGE